MHTDVKSPPAWDLADKKTQKTRFVSMSFYIVVDGISSVSTRAACSLIKDHFQQHAGVRVRGPKAMPTERRRYMVMRDMCNGSSHKGVYLSQSKRYRNILLVSYPSSSSVSSLIGLTLPSEVNIRIEPYNNQYGLREDR